MNFKEMTLADFRSFVASRQSLIPQEELELVLSKREDLISDYIREHPLGDVTTNRLVKDCSDALVAEYLRRYAIFGSAITSLIERGNYPLLRIGIERQLFCVKEQRLLLRHGNDDLLRQYFDEFCFSPVIETELLQGDKQELIEYYLGKHPVWKQNKNLIPRRKLLATWLEMWNSFWDISFERKKVMMKAKSLRDIPRRYLCNRGLFKTLCWYWDDLMSNKKHLF